MAMFPTPNQDVYPIETEQFPLKLSVLQGLTSSTHRFHRDKKPVFTLPPFIMEVKNVSIQYYLG